MKTLSCLCAALLFLAATGPCHAGTASGRITESGVRKLYQDAAKSYKGSFAGFQENLEASLADDFSGVMKITSQLPGKPATTNTVPVTKGGLLADAQQNYDSTQNAENDNLVNKIVIAPDGQTAQVEDKSTIRNMKLALGSQTLSVDGNGLCADNLVISANGQIQIAKSYCEITYVYRVTK